MDFSSATLASCGSQTLFRSDGAPHTGRMYVVSEVTGTFPFSFFFSNIADSTFADGSESVHDQLLDAWRILGACVAVSDTCVAAFDYAPRTKIRFSGLSEKDVAPGERFASDPVTLTVRRGQYLSLELTFAGRTMPCHRESIIPLYTLQNGVWTPEVNMPVPCMTGCLRPVRKRVCFWGDSITQGIGTPHNSYLHYAAQTARLLQNDRDAYWDIGLGFARASDAASDGVWMARAKENDVVSVCFGVNDLLRGADADTLYGNLYSIVQKLHACGCRVLLQTIPPFGFSNEREKTRKAVNARILSERPADAHFDCGRVLAAPEDGARAMFGNHPDAQGCCAWARALTPVLKELIQ